MRKKFHYQIGFPRFVFLPQRNISLFYTSHAQHASTKDKYGRIRLFRTLNLRKCTLIEVETDDDVVTKYLIRTEYDDEHDVVYALRPTLTGPWIVKTVWLNEKNDVHKTLNTSLYMTP